MVFPICLFPICLLSLSDLSATQYRQLDTTAITSSPMAITQAIIAASRTISSAVWTTIQSWLESAQLYLFAPSAYNRLTDLLSLNKDSRRVCRGCRRYCPRPFFRHSNGGVTPTAKCSRCRRKDRFDAAKKDGGLMYAWTKEYSRIFWVVVVTICLAIYILGTMLSINSTASEKNSGASNALSMASVTRPEKMTPVPITVLTHIAATNGANSRADMSVQTHILTKWTL